LVIVAGWAPTIHVQSGGEVSLDSATIILKVESDFRILYSSALFAPGGLVRDQMPHVKRELVGTREI